MLSALLLVAVACTPAATPASPQPPMATPDTAPSPSPALPRGFTPLPLPVPMPPEVDLPDTLLQPIYADVIERSGASLDQIQVVRAEAVVWPDPSLGCPQPGMAYPQVLVEGYWVILEVDGTQYDYRGSGVGQFILCELPPRDRFEPVPGNGGLDY